MKVIDPSVAAKWTVKEADHLEALALVGFDAERVASDLLLPELAHVPRKKAIRGEIVAEQPGLASAAVKRAIGQFVPSAHLVEKA